MYLVGFVPYIYAIWHTRRLPFGALDKAEPEKVSWIIWAALDIIIAAGMYAEKSVNGLIVGATIGCWATALLAMKYGKPGWTWAEKFCLATAATSIILWKLFENPTLAILACVFAALVGSIPTFKSAWKNPGRENKLAWAIFSMGAVLAVIALEEWTVAKAAMPVSAIMIDATVTTIVLLRSRRLS